jgi:ABC-2 type transport system ATP-binding protein
VSVIEVEHLHKRYGTVEAVRDVSFSVDRGSVVGFLGPNGAGKSTTLRILAGYLGATSGTVRIGGHDILDERLAAIRQIGYMPETSPLYPEMRVREYLAFRAELKGIPRARRAVEIDRVLGAARVRDMERRLVAQLSKGYRQRLGLADALLGAPPLLILDEPTAGLDPNQIKDVRALIRELGGEHTVLLSTHILSEVEASCEQAIVIHAGKLVARGSLAELRKTDVRHIELVVDAAGAAAPHRELPQGPLAILQRVEGVVTARVEEGKKGDGAAVARITLVVDPSLEPDDVSGRVSLALAAQGIAVRRLAPISASLEEVFALLTREPEGAGVPPAGATSATAKRKSGRPKPRPTAPED